jgi:hypothetical protein
MKYHYPFISVRAATAMAAVFFFLSAMQAGAQKQYCSSSRGFLDNGYHYELWTNGGGSVCMTPTNVDAKFKTVWSSVGDFVARVGLSFDETKTAEQLGTITANYTFTKSGLNHLTYMGVYGWMTDPLIEYYILEDWNEWHPTAGSEGHTSKGTISVDGGQYDILTKTQTNQPSIKGTATFQQWWSIRKSTRQSGQISISQHFAAWKNAGMTPGKMYEAKLIVEAMQGNGTIDYTTATVLLNNKPPTPPTISLAPGTLPEQRSFFKNGNASGVQSLISLNGTVIRSMRLNGIEPVLGSTENLAPGIYIQQFQGDGKAPVSRTLLVK